MKKIAVYCILSVLFCNEIMAQSLLDGLGDDAPKKEFVTNAFKSSRVINGHSMEFIGEGVLDFRLLHRFGTVKEGISNFFGLDQASMRMGFDYGISKNFTIGIGRTTYKKEIDGFAKWRLIQQSTGPKSSPFSLVLVSGISIFTYANNDPSKTLGFNERTGYYFQTILGRKFNDNFSLQISPTIVHRNIVEANDENDIYAIGLGTRFKMSKRVALVVDYFYVANGLPNKTGKNPLSIGVDIETGGHVFQLHFSNALGMNERSFITETTNSWGKGEFQFGFNLSRVFTVKKKKTTL